MSNEYLDYWHISLVNCAFYLSLMSLLVFWVLVRELSLRKLQRRQLGIHATLLHQCIVLTHLDNTSMLHHHNTVGLLHSG